MVYTHVLNRGPTGCGARLTTESHDTYSLPIYAQHSLALGLPPLRKAPRNEWRRRPRRAA